MELDDEYRTALHHAVEYVHVVAARRGLDTRQLVVTIDADRDAGIYWDHTLKISVRSAVFSVTADAVPHSWIEIGTGFIDPRFSQRVTTLLAELEKMWVGS